MEKTPKNTFATWLERLQQESWQLELLISGFAIFLLIEAYGPINNLGYQVELLASATFDQRFQLLHIPYYILLSSWYILIINLILHVLLRGLWISTIGLRSVSGGIDFKSLRLSPKFDRFLRKRIVNFDVYIQQLEKLCSIIFAFTFLILFLLLSIGLLVGITTILTIYTKSLLGDTKGWHNLPVILFLLLAGIYFLDFMTLGWIKRQKIVSKLYYPVYRFFSTLTLAFIYRPLYYNMADNTFGRRVILFLIPYSLILAIALSLKVRAHMYLPANRAKQSIENAVYDDTWDQNRPSFSASIPSKFINNGYVPLFLPYYPPFDDVVLSVLCGIEPVKTGIFFFDKEDSELNRMNADAALACHARRFSIFINDSLFHDLEYQFYDHPLREAIGLLTVLDVAYLPRGKHSIRVVVKLPRSDEGVINVVDQETVAIHFWKE